MMGSLPIDPKNAHGIIGLMLIIGTVFLIFATLGWTIGAMPGGSRYSPRLILREYEPIKFYFLLAVTSVGGVILFFGGLIGLCVY